MSRYATGLAQQSIYNPLRAGGSFFLGLTVLCFAAAVGLALWQFKIVAVLSIMNRVVPVILIVLGFEILINGVFDIYRPRIEGLYSRASFDSRILGIINEPGRVFKTAAGAIDYQFGFNVSETWFYKLLEKAIIPLVLFSSAILYLMSSFVVIAPDEKAVIEHFGNSVDVQGNKRILEPGLAIKWPWPIDIVRKYPVKKVKQVNIGFVPALKPDGSIDIKPRLWEKSHYKKEYNLLVATPQSDTQSDESGAIPVSLIRAAVPVQYVVNDIYAFLYNHQKPQQVLEDICYRELTRFAAASRIEADEDENLEKSLLGAGRAPARKILSANIQAAADAANLGIKVVFVGLEGIHPPPEVALDYQKVVGAVQKKQALILNAHAIRNLQLSELAGSVDAANDLYKLVGQYQDARMQKDDKKIDLLAKELDDAFANAKGDIFKKLRTAQSYAYQRSEIAAATGKRFASQLKAYQAGPNYFKNIQRLLVLEEALKNTRKYIVVADKNDTQVFIVDLQEKLAPSLYDLGGIEENAQ
jgi:regulator of protease activity HflC (stomatin/prohibitin superfamily)